MKRTGIVVLFVFVLAAAGLAFGQLTPTGKITGKVIDNQGGGSPGRGDRCDQPQAGREGLDGHRRQRDLSLDGPSVRDL